MALREREQSTGVVPSALPAAVAEFLQTKPDSGSPDDPISDRRTAIGRASDELFRMFGAPAAAIVGVHEVVAPNGAAGVRLRIYRPRSESTLPVHVFLHGGGWWLGSVDELVNDALCHHRAAAAQCIVVAVEYRLAPEHPFPAAYDDCRTGLAWAATHAEEFGGDPTTVSVGGISAGATLAAAVALASRTDGRSLVGQILEVPPLDLTLHTMQDSGVPDDYGITVAEMTWCSELYLAGADPRDPRASPLLATDLRGSAPAHLLAAEFDPLRLDAERYGERLREAGVSVRLTVHPGAVHGSLALTGSWSGARVWQQEVVEALRSIHGTPAAAPTQEQLPA